MRYLKRDNSNYRLKYKINANGIFKLKASFSRTHQKCAIKIGISSVQFGEIAKPRIHVSVSHTVT